MKKVWTEQEIILIESMYKNGDSINEIARKMDRSISSVRSKSAKLRLGDKYMRTNNAKFNAVYQSYEWCYQHYIINGEDMERMAEIAGTTVRTIRKWCSEKYQLNKDTFRHIKKLTPIQKEIIMFGRLGDGHIDRRQNEPMYIESHAENQKQYLFWKWEILKDLCNMPPSYIGPNIKIFHGKEYLTQPQYRLNTRVLDALIPIRDMAISDIISQLNEFGLSLHLLDDGSRDYTRWTVCVASFSINDKKLYIDACKRLGLNAHILTDDRYIGFDSVSSRKIDKIIVKHVPETIDIIQDKILKNNVSSDGYYIYVLTNTGRVGLSTFCKNNGLNYTKCRDYAKQFSGREIPASEILNKDF